MDIKGSMDIRKQSLSGNIAGQKKSLSGNLEKTKQNRNYEDLINKPSINDVELFKNKTPEELGLQEKMVSITPQQIDKIIMGGITWKKKIT